MAVYKIIPASVLIEQYKIMGCAMYLVPTYDPSASPFDFREPDQPGITKAGWIKSEVISMLLKNNEVRIRFVLDIPIFHATTRRLLSIGLIRYHRRNITPFSATLTSMTYGSQTPLIKPVSPGEDTWLFQKSRPWNGTQGLSEKHLGWETSRR